MTALEENEKRLSFAAVRQLAPPVRLVSAAVWKVLKQRDVKHYGAVEEFVSSVCDTVPGLLALGHRVKLTLGIRARLILDLLSNHADTKLIEEHLESLRFPAEYAAEDVKVWKSVEDFLKLIDSLVLDQKAKDKFFKEVFVQDYGPVQDQELETLMWEFLIALDRLLPIPSLLQTVEWLSGAPFVKEECVLAASQPQLLNILLQHQVSLGHLDNAACPSNSGDSTLTSLSLPPSGKAPFDWTAGHSTLCVEDRHDTQAEKENPLILPVIGSISNEDVPVMVSVRTRRQKACEAAGSKPTPEKNTGRFTVVLPKSKDDRPGLMQKGRKRGMKRKFEQSRVQADEEGEMNVECNVTLQESKKTLSSSETMLYMPDDPSLRPIFLSCLNKKAKVVIKRVSPASLPSPRKKISSRPGGTRYSISASTCKPLSRTHRTQDTCFPGSKNKENHPVIKDPSFPLLQNGTELSSLTSDADDYVADSEDEASKNFKGRLFSKRYYKTRHGTYVPTLREFWRPCTTQPDTFLKRKHR
ncbi:TERF1-interacting nuclear factor 2 [Synchiropus splendidus]|uniref:TERF1-interacting nuclear factor 2 n=1 Tax=Synchiropus splendidus TaxID=270530 RepID=UPI00237E8EEE|nr:TERF1-interacting nuclear factor 2 [Synchiropus splendidus]